MDELALLQAEFEQVQLVTLRNLSERSCVEIIIKLIEAKKLELIYTVDGKEFLTHKQLRREIEDEILLRNGRVNIIDLQSALSVDLSHIENKVDQLVSGSRMYHLIHGDVIASYYFDTLAKEINETLQESGAVKFPSLKWPFDFLFPLLS